MLFDDLRVARGAGGRRRVRLQRDERTLAADRIEQAGSNVVRVSVRQPLANGIYAERDLIVRASGGARSYLTRGHLANGFGLVAWPARYGDTGVMSFLINHDGVVYQKNLGAASASIASAMTRFDPDATWTPLPAP